MTLDSAPEGWRRISKLFLLWVDLPEAQANQLWDALSQSEQDRLLAFVITRGDPGKALKDFEKYFKKFGFNAPQTLIKKLPRPELEKLVKAGLKRGKLIDNLSKMDVEELQELVFLCSCPKDFLAFFVFIEGLAPERKEFLLA